MVALHAANLAYTIIAMHYLLSLLPLLAVALMYFYLAVNE
jgi:hypothetical protein